MNLEYRKGTHNWYSHRLDSNVSAPLFCKEQARPLLSMLEHVIGSYRGLDRAGTGKEDVANLISPCTVQMLWLEEALEAGICTGYEGSLISSK